MRARVLATISLIIVGLAPVFSHAATQELSVTPVVIDDKAHARDILTETITLTNTSSHKLEIYPSVNNVAPKDGEQPFAPAQGSQDLQASLANWIELSRGVIELSPGETRDVPFIIHVNLNALPGTYHAQISLFSGSTRDAAEAAGSLADVTVNLEVQADVKEVMQLDKFSVGKFFLAGDDVRFDYQLENIGNQDLMPHGEIRVYDRTGSEVASVDVNKEGKAVSPEQIAQLASVWSAAEGFGQYKALLTVYYGKNQTASVQDTVFFWVVPWKQLLMIFVAGLIGVIIMAFYVHRWLEERHGMKPVSVAAVAAAAAKPESAGAPEKPAAGSRFGLLKTVAVLPFAIVAAGVSSAFRAVGKLKRGERAVPARVPEPAAPEVPAVAAVADPTPVAPAPAPQSSGTIDLKNFRAAPMEEQPVTHEGHVIDLKRMR